MTRAFHAHLDEHSRPPIPHLLAGVVSIGRSDPVAESVAGLVDQAARRALLHDSGDSGVANALPAEIVRAIIPVSDRTSSALSARGQAAPRCTLLPRSGSATP